MRGLALLVGGVGLLVAMVFAVSPVLAASSAPQPGTLFKAGVVLKSEVVTVSQLTMTACQAKHKKELDDCKAIMAKDPKAICLTMCNVCCGKALKVTNTATFTIPKGKMLKVFRKAKVGGKSWTPWTSYFLVDSNFPKGATKTILGGCEQSECVDTNKYEYKVETADPPPPPA